MKVKTQNAKRTAVNHSKKGLRLTWRRTLRRCWSACTSPCHCYTVPCFHPPHPPSPTHTDKKGGFLELGLPLNKQNRLWLKQKLRLSCSDFSAAESQQLLKACGGQSWAHTVKPGGEGRKSSACQHYQPSPNPASLGKTGYIMAKSH